MFPSRDRVSPSTTPYQLSLNDQKVFPSGNCVVNTPSPPFHPKVRVNNLSYFLSLKDDAKLVKKYAFVSVENYQIVATGDSVAQAEQAYYALLEANGKKTDSSEYKTNELTGAITAINEAVVDGNSTYYFKLEGSDTIFIGDISLSNQFPLAKVGDVVTIEYVNSKDNSEVITSIKFG